jgi:hypothetical protein
MPESEIEHTEAEKLPCVKHKHLPPTVNRAARNSDHAEKKTPKRRVDRMWHRIGKDPGIERVGSVP